MVAPLELGAQHRPGLRVLGRGRLEQHHDVVAGLEQGSQEAGGEPHGAQSGPARRPRRRRARGRGRPRARPRTGRRGSRAWPRTPCRRCARRPRPPRRWPPPTSSGSPRRRRAVGPRRRSGHGWPAPAPGGTSAPVLTASGMRDHSSSEVNAVITAINAPTTEREPSMPNAYPVLYRLGMNWWEDNDDTGPLADVVAHRPAGGGAGCRLRHRRHAVWLAQQGWTVVGVDGVEKALREARARAAAAGVAERTTFIKDDVARLAEVPTSPAVRPRRRHRLLPRAASGPAEVLRRLGQPPHPRGRRRGRPRGRPADRRSDPGASTRRRSAATFGPAWSISTTPSTHQGRRSAAPRRPSAGSPCPAPPARPPTSGRRGPDHAARPVSSPSYGPVRTTSIRPGLLLTVAGPGPSASDCPVSTVRVPPTARSAP